MNICTAEVVRTHQQTAKSISTKTGLKQPHLLKQPECWMKSLVTTSTIFSIVQTPKETKENISLNYFCGRSTARQATNQTSLSSWVKTTTGRLLTTAVCRALNSQWELNTLMAQFSPIPLQGQRKSLEIIRTKTSMLVLEMIGFTGKGAMTR